MRDRLIKSAFRARHNAYSPYSHLRVGAAVLARGGKIYSSGNVENCCYALTICAERGALYHAIAAGEKHLKMLAVTANTNEFISPCGACRQVIWELAGDIDILMINRKKQTRTIPLSALYPVPYKKKAKRRLWKDHLHRHSS